jgi:myo-inositol-1(or 4)-monophosphatase
MSSMMVASGKADGYILYRPKPCDIAAAGLIVEEAGGKVTDLEGNPWTPYSRSFVATNGKIHDELLSRLKEEVL